MFYEKQLKNFYKFKIDSILQIKHKLFTIKTFQNR